MSFQYQITLIVTQNMLNNSVNNYVIRKCWGFLLLLCLRFHFWIRRRKIEKPWNGGTFRTWGGDLKNVFLVNQCRSFVLEEKINENVLCWIETWLDDFWVVKKIRNFWKFLQRFPNFCQNYTYKYGFDIFIKFLRLS